MNEKYPYRFKTKEELIKEFGDKWRHGHTCPYIPEHMDYLLGTVLPFTENYLKENNYYIRYRSGIYNWLVCKYMITKQSPNYNPVGKIKRTI